MIDRDDMPIDPDFDHVTADLLLLSELTGGRVVVIEPDGVSQDVLVLVPSMWRRAAQEDND